eukprot:9061234-Ditylum_brightwellii.AAC.1
MESNMRQLTQMMEVNSQRMRETISSVLQTQGDSCPSQSAIGLGHVEQGSASNAMEGLVATQRPVRMRISHTSSQITLQLCKIYSYRHKPDQRRSSWHKRKSIMDNITDIT